MAIANRRSGSSRGPLTTRMPASSTVEAITSSSGRSLVATTTSAPVVPARCAASTTIGRPAALSIALPGSRVELSRDWSTTRTRGATG